jgi:hypothetical protein
MASHYNRSAEVLPLHRGVKMPPEEAHGGTSPLARRAIDIDAIERRLRDDRPDLIDCLRQQQREADALADYNSDLRVIGWGLFAGSMFVVIFRLAQLGWI